MESDVIYGWSSFDLINFVASDEAECVCNIDVAYFLRAILHTDTLHNTSDVMLMTSHL